MLSVAHGPRHQRFHNREAFTTRTSKGILGSARSLGDATSCRLRLLAAATTTTPRPAQLGAQLGATGAPHTTTTPRPAQLGATGAPHTADLLRAARRATFVVCGRKV